MKKQWNKILRYPDDGNGAGGGSGGGTGNGSLIGGSGNAGSSQEGGAGAASGGAGGGNNAGSGNGSGGAAATDWRSGLPKELQEDASLKKFTSVHALASSYLHAQKLVGADKIPVPTKHTTAEEWKQIYHKLGVPEKVEDYKIAFKDGVPVDEKFSTAFRQKAFEMGILPSQAQALADWFGESTLATEQAMQAEAKKNFDTVTANLKKDWGNAFDLNLARAEKAVKELGGPDMLKYVAESGLGGNEKFLKIMVAAGEKLFGDDKVIEGQGTTGVMSPKELEAEIAKLQANPAYFDKLHPQHKTIVADVKDLYEKRYNTKK